MFKKIATLTAVAALAITGVGVASAATSSAPQPAKSYGLCINSKGGVRVLEARNLIASKYGKCKAGERKLLLPSIDGVPKAINGKSAYEIWVAQTANVGKTEAQFLESLKGKDATLPAKVQFKFGTTTAVCMRGTDTTAGVPAYDCVPPTS